MFMKEISDKKTEKNMLNYQTITYLDCTGLGGLLGIYLNAAKCEFYYRGFSINKNPKSYGSN